jgi:hypothetical protein
MRMARILPDHRNRAGMVVGVERDAMNTLVSATLLVVAASACVMAWNSIPAGQPHRWTHVECAQYEGAAERAAGNTDWISTGKLTEICARLGHP